MHLAEPGCAVTDAELERHEHYVKFLAEVKVSLCLFQHSAGARCVLAALGACAFRPCGPQSSWAWAFVRMIPRVLRCFLLSAWCTPTCCRLLLAAARCHVCCRMCVQAREDFDVRVMQLTKARREGAMKAKTGRGGETRYEARLDSKKHRATSRRRLKQQSVWGDEEEEEQEDAGRLGKAR